MKKDIHPTYNHSVEATCACGDTFMVGSTVDKIEVEVCSSCHPFFTGQERVVDTAGRVEKFKARQAKASATPKKKKVTKKKEEEVAAE